MNDTKQQIELFDKIFNYFIEHYINRTQKDKPTKVLFEKMFNVKYDIAQEAINLVCEYGIDLKLLKAYKTGYGNYSVLEMYKMSSINFKDQGGFKKYFKDKERLIKQEPMIKIVNNNTQSQTQTQSQSIEVTQIIKSFENELTVEQIKELNSIIKENNTKDKGKKITDKLLSFGSNVAASILANILTNPQIIGL